MKLEDYLAARGHGSAIELARKVDATAHQMSMWRNGVQPVPANKAIQIHVASGGLIGLHEMRPDLFHPDYQITTKKER